MNHREILKTKWAALAPRERYAIAVAAALTALALLWWIALAPALHTLSTARGEHARLDAQMQQMVTLRMQAKALQAKPRANRDDALHALQESVRNGLGPNTRIQPGIAGETSNVILRGAAPEALAQWLTQARGNAQAVPREVHLTRAQAADNATPSWDGTIVMALPVSR